MVAFVATEKQDTIGIITLNRPDKLNAWHQPMRDQFVDALKTYEADSTIGAVPDRIWERPPHLIRTMRNDGLRDGGSFMGRCAV